VINRALGRIMVDRLPVGDCLYRAVSTLIPQHLWPNY